MFGRPKKEIPKAPEPPTNTEVVDIKGQSKGANSDNQGNQKLSEVIWAEFARDYQGAIGAEEWDNMPQSSRDAQIVNLLIAIYGELRLIRDASTKQA